MKAFLFPGQGSQEVGMGADLFKSDSAFRRLVSLASELVGEDLERTCLRGPEKRLAQTRLLQPLLVAVSLGYLRCLNEQGARPDLVLGHSLGEITALAAAGIVTPDDAVRIAVRRGELMEEAAFQVDGAMLVVSTEDRAGLLDWIASAQPGNKVVLANDNAPTQVVLSGERSAIAACAEFISAGKLGKSRFLAVSGPWHSPFMAAAATRFEDWLREIPMRPPRTPMLFGVEAAGGETVENIRAMISGALARPVRWSSCMAALRAMNPSRLYEVGPGGVLSGLARANGLGGEIPILRVGSLRGVESAVRSTESCPAPPPLLMSDL